MIKFSYFYFISISPSTTISLTILSSWGKEGEWDKKSTTSISIKRTCLNNDEMMKWWDGEMDDLFFYLSLSQSTISLSASLSTISSHNLPSHYLSHNLPSHLTTYHLISFDVIRSLWWISWKGWWGERELSYQVLRW